ncbi:Hypothetical protein R9X50_00684800 [Acrodontium crateriforme]|uniref:Ubiquitin-like protease family profile domain-containing protein n=1 Tax=Acrodontium crateriforme TaxID=150365 RepID=A0AAQ3MAF0_9PEZI|nr:Hypothetical protein R9X50_00684800 [Acrodontium crateriforme]
MSSQTLELGEEDAKAVREFTTSRQRKFAELVDILNMLKELPGYTRLSSCLPLESKATFLREADFIVLTEAKNPQRFRKPKLHGDKDVLQAEKERQIPPENGLTEQASIHSDSDDDDHAKMDTTQGNTERAVTTQEYRPLLSRNYVDGLVQLQGKVGYEELRQVLNEACNVRHRTKPRGVSQNERAAWDVTWAKEELLLRGILQLPSPPVSHSRKRKLDSSIEDNDDIERSIEIHRRANSSIFLADGPIEDENDDWGHFYADASMSDDTNGFAAENERSTLRFGDDCSESTNDDDTNDLAVETQSTKLNSAGECTESIHENAASSRKIAASIFDGDKSASSSEFEGFSDSINKNAIDLPDDINSDHALDEPSLEQEGLLAEPNFPAETPFEDSQQTHNKNLEFSISTVHIATMPEGKISTEDSSSRHEHVQMIESSQSSPPASSIKKLDVTHVISSSSLPKLEAIPDEHLYRAIQRLRPGSWLNTESIEEVLKMFNPDPTLFSIIRVDSIPGRRQLAARTCIILINLNNIHWTVAVGTNILGTYHALLYDPLYDTEYINSSIALLQPFLNERLQPQGLDEHNRVSWTISVLSIGTGPIQQRDSYNCGINIVLYAISRMNNIDLSPTIDPNFWRQVFYTMLSFFHQVDPWPTSSPEQRENGSMKDSIEMKESQLLAVKKIFQQVSHALQDRYTTLEASRQAFVAQAKAAGQPLDVIRPYMSELPPPPNLQCYRHIQTNVEENLKRIRQYLQKAQTMIYDIVQAEQNHGELSAQEERDLEMKQKELDDLTELIQSRSHARQHTLIHQKQELDQSERAILEALI